MINGPTFLFSLKPIMDIINGVPKKGNSSILPFYRKCRNCGHYSTTNTPIGGTCPNCGSRI